MKKDNEEFEERTFFGKVSRVESSEFEPEVFVFLSNVSNVEVKLPARLYGTPDKLGVYLDTVRKIE